MAQQWGLAHHVRALVFDTTVSNSGWKIGACVQLERLLNKKMLMLAWRHHVFERILCAVHKELFGDTLGPDNTFFTNCRDSIWKHINTEQEFKTLQISNRALKSRRDTVILSLKRILTVPDKNNTLPRDDYRECRTHASSFMRDAGARCLLDEARVSSPCIMDAVNFIVSKDVCFKCSVGLRQRHD